MVEERQSKISSSIKAYGKALLSFIRKRVKNDQDAEDVLQDVWYQFSAVVNSEPIDQIGAWLYRVARNRIIDTQRKRKEEPWTAHDSDEDTVLHLSDVLLANPATPETEYLKEMIWNCLYAALEELPPEQKKAFVWHELEGTPFSEIAETTGIPMGTWVLRKRYAVLHLRKRLQHLYKEFVND
ncbi:sigma-70 family RNA polymerase sigma factor [Olivibacter sp. SDN3]|nr:sigma-70 family RNA polymerase sigma factor [Olivibacter sp. SDN3]